MLIFIHGLESSGSGFKGKFFKKIFPDILTPDFSGPLLQRLKQLNKILKNEKNITIIGSSFGGLMGSIFNIQNEEKVSKLILLAPALNLYADFFKNKKTPTPTIIYHGIKDNIIPLDSIEDIAINTFIHLKLNKVDDDHMLHDTIKKINWQEIIF
jgi:predicted esterase